MQDGLDAWSRHVAVGDGALGLAAQHGVGERDCARGTCEVRVRCRRGSHGWMESGWAEAGTMKWGGGRGPRTVSRHGEGLMHIDEAEVGVLGDQALLVGGWHVALVECDIIICEPTGYGTFVAAAIVVRHLVLLFGIASAEEQNRYLASLAYSQVKKIYSFY